MTKEKEQENREVDKAKGIVTGSINSDEKNKEDIIISGETKKAITQNGAWSYKKIFKTRKNKIVFAGITLLAILLISIVLGLNQNQNDTAIKSQNVELKNYINNLEKQEKEYKDSNKEQAYFDQLLEGYRTLNNCNSARKVYEQKVSQTSINLSIEQAGWLAECYKNANDKNIYKELLNVQKNLLQNVLMSAPENEKTAINAEIVDVEDRINNVQ